MFLLIVFDKKMLFRISVVGFKTTEIT